MSKIYILLKDCKKIQAWFDLISLYHMKYL